MYFRLFFVQIKIYTLYIQIYNIIYKYKYIYNNIYTNINIIYKYIYKYINIIQYNKQYIQIYTLYTIHVGKNNM